MLYYHHDIRPDSSNPYAEDLFVWMDLALCKTDADRSAYMWAY